MSTIGNRRSRPLAFIILTIAMGCRAAPPLVPLDEEAVVKELNTFSDGSLQFSGTIPEKLTLTMAEAQSICLLQHPRLRRARAERGIADAAAIRAEGSGSTELTITPLWALPESVAAGVLSLRWELIPSDRRDAARALAATLQQSTNANVAREEWRLANEARIAWLLLFFADQNITFADEIVATARELYDFTKRRVEGGVALASDLAAASVDLATAEGDAAAARDARIARCIELSLALGLPSNCNINISTPPDALSVPLPILPEGNDDLFLLERHPALAAARARYGFSEAELRLAWLDRNQTLRIGPDVQRDTTSTFVGGTLSASFNSTNTNQANTKEADAKRAIAREEFAIELFEVKAALASARAEYQIAGGRYAAHRDAVLQKAQDTVDTTRREVIARAADMTKLFLATDRLARARRDSFSYQHALALAAARLEAAMGPGPASK